ncbi:hypothetical protein SAY87_030345 [Trapa incisa]|uniref:Single-stranded DNA binding protein Ssb-like OB fold domain-containing protein n=1 Tax=Trapa incisa TaxID=236973 RepID=A0AAN7KIF7_9MYRT|nr:hypothetical protein SAY87_030345 [Trapa incisa]
MASRSRAAPRQATYAPKPAPAPAPAPGPPPTPTPSPAVMEKRKPVFTKVDRLQPGTSGHNLTVKVVNSKDVPMNARVNRPTSSSKAVLSRPPARVSRISECLIGDETGSIIFTARNEQVDIMKAGATVILRNAKIDMFKGTMRLAVDKWGRVEVTEPASFEVKEDNNLSLVEYELVNVTEE